MEIHHDVVAATFGRERRKPLQKRHSVAASCLKQTKTRPPLKRRVSFSKEKTLHLISKENQKKQWEPSPKFSEFLTAQKPMFSEPADFLDEPDLLNETMAIDITNDFTAGFSAQFLESPDDEDNTLLNLVEQDDSLLLPGMATHDDTNCSGSSTSEITFLGGQLDNLTDQMFSFSDNDDNSEMMMDFEETEEFFASCPDETRIRDTPAQTPLHSSRLVEKEQPVSHNGPKLVDEFLSQVHIHFRIFNSIRENSVATISARDVEFLCEPNDILLGVLERDLLTMPRVGLLAEKTQKYENEIESIKDLLTETSKELSKENPKCFDSDILCRKQLKDIKNQAQEYAKLQWYNDRIDTHEQLNEYLFQVSELLESKIQEMNQQLTAVDSPLNSTETIFSENSHISTNTVDHPLKEKACELVDEFDILRSLPGWELTQSDSCPLKVTFGTYIQISFDSLSGIINTSFSLIPGVVCSGIKRKLLSSIGIEKYVNAISSIKEIPSVLDELSIWIGRTEDFLEECERLQKFPGISVNENTQQTHQKCTKIEVSFTGPNKLSAEPLVLSCLMDIKSYPSGLSFDFPLVESISEKKLLLSKLNSMFSNCMYLEDLCEALAQ